MLSAEAGQLLPIHFDLPRHTIPLRTFVQTAESAAKIANQVNTDLFGGSLVLEVVVIPPEEGSFLTKLGFLVVSVGLFAGAAIISGPLGDFGSGVFEELVNTSPTDAGRKLVQVAKAALEELLEETDDKEAKCIAASALTVATVRWLLEEDNSAIESVGLSEVLAEVLVEKRRFYSACEDVPDLRGIGFDETPHFPIQRRDFHRISRLPDTPTSPTWHVAVENITATSPNWNRMDHARKWKAQDKDGHSRFFTIADELFWERVFRGELKTRVADSLRVQWAYQIGQKGQKNHTVLSVLEFNGVLVSPEKSEREIRPFLDSFVTVDEFEPSLFDAADNN
jgi:hypothetical protein